MFALLIALETPAIFFQSEQSALDKLKSSNKGVVKCRICKEDHWTTQCPYKNTLGPLK